MDKRQEEIMTTITRNVRCLTRDQIADEWCCNLKAPKRSATRIMERLSDEGLALIETKMARQPSEFKRPLHRHTPGDPSPDSGAIAWKLKGRWDGPPTPTVLLTATEKANNIFGGRFGGWPIRNQEVTHEIHVAAVFLETRKSRPDLVARWHPESTSTGSPKRADVTIAGFGVIEVGGSSYNKEKLEAFHEQFKHQYYELW